MMPPLELKLYQTPDMKEEIPFVGFPDKAVEMNTEGEVVAYVVNKANYPYVLKEAWHDDPHATPIFEETTLHPDKPVKITLKWKPPYSEDQEQWKPLKGGIHIKGYYVIE